MRKTLMLRYEMCFRRLRLLNQRFRISFKKSLRHMGLEYREAKLVPSWKYRFHSLHEGLCLHTKHRS